MIRAAKVTDAAAIATIIVHSWRATYAEILSAESLASLSVEERTEAWTTRLREQMWPTLVCEVDGSVVGFVSYDQCKDDDKTSQRTGEVIAIYLLPSYLGRGLGREMFETALSQLKAKGFDQVVVWVLHGNNLGIHFYEKMGFAKDGVTKKDVIRGSEVLKVRYVR